MTLDEVRRINDRRLARQGQKYYAEDKVYIGNSDGSLSLIVKDVQNQYNPIAGTGISITGNYPSQTITNTLPDQTVALTAGTGISVSGTYPSFTITNTATSGGILHGTALGTDTYTSTITGVTSYADGDAYLIRFTNGNTVASPTLNINVPVVPTSPKEYTAKTGFVTGELNVHVYGCNVSLYKFIECVSIGFLSVQVLKS